MGGVLSSIRSNRGRKRHHKKKKRRRYSSSSSDSDFSSSEHHHHHKNQGKKVTERIQKFENLEKDSTRNQNQKIHFVFPNAESDMSSRHSDGDIDVKKFEKDCLAAHNEYRRCHGVPPLKLSKDCTRAAQKWAKHIAGLGMLKHSQDRDNMGENIAWTSAKSYTGTAACKQWYDEIKDYSFRRPGFKGNTGHFTQVVWKDSTEVGIGVATSSKGTFVVANYRPAGNVVNGDLFERNVFPLKSGMKPNIQSDDKPKKKESSHRTRSRSRSSSSSSSSSSDDEKSAKDNNKSGTKVDTKTEIYTENGRKYKKITTTTTKVKVSGGRKTTSTETSTKIEEITDDDKDHKKVHKDLKNLNLKESKDKDKKDESSGKGLSKKEVEQFRKECLDKHNEYRKKHGVPALTRDPTLEKAAQKWAEHLLKQNRLEHSQNSGYGENVAYKMQLPARYVSGQEICDMWYNEIKDYKFKEPGFRSNTGHFTQVVWKDSRNVGIGVASKGGYTFVVANYNPPGNFRGEFEKNVLEKRR